MERIETLPVRIGKNLVIGGNAPIVVQTMCNTHTSDVEASVAQCLELAAAGAQMIRLTVPGLQDVEPMRQIKERLRAQGCEVPLVADIHFSSKTALAVAPIVEKVRINPGNVHPEHEKAREEFRKLIGVCREHGTAIRIGLNHGSLGAYITNRYGNTPHAMAVAAMEWVRMCKEEQFYNVVVSLKASNTVVMTGAYRELVAMMQAEGTVFPLHLGVTESGNGDSGRIKSCVGIAALLQEGIGDTIRVSLTEPPVAELPVARYISEHGALADGSTEPMLDAAIKWGPKLLKREIDEIPASAGIDEYLTDEIMQASRRRFYKAEYIACPGCGRTMYDLQGTFEQVKARTSHLKGVVIAVMGCIVNGPGEMADADWGYVGEGGGKVSIYKKGQPVLRHVPDYEAIDKLVELISGSE
ncbi:MAG: (E)-4-hydroxy-3-methylbut-2-enyl-diphosphate synthase [Candidatus Cryptobacteroides sp.]|nr:(E)-4-hydroxy-3-methylbut-2-enyl-diphosphate synthase [Rikenellaceae bacterium]MDY5747433.1 (E)-4-hydroxy-3-methylbut-2-enyl-diphosphate synthase [Candidatus Cryptobacteroides sp.]